MPRDRRLRRRRAARLRRPATVATRSHRTARRPALRRRCATAPGLLVIALVTLIGGLPPRARRSRRWPDEQRELPHLRVWTVAGDTAALRHRRLLWTTVRLVGHRDAHRRAARRRRGAVHHAVRAPLARAAGRAPGRPARRGALDRLRPLGRCRLRPATSPPIQTALEDVLGWIPLFARRPASTRRHDLLRRDRPRRSWSCRSSPPSRARCSPRRPPTHKEARAGPRRHPLGDDPHRGAAVRPPRRHQRRRCSASAARSARPSPSRSSSPPWPTALPGRGRSSTAARRSPRKIANNAGRVRQPAEDRRLHRRRPGAVRPDLRRQRDRPRRHRAQEGLHRMSDHRRPALDAAPRRRRSSARRPGRRSSGRAIRNQIARIVMWAAFFLAVVPLVWILWHRRQQGRPAAARVARGGPTPSAASPPRDVGGGADHAIQGTLIQALGHRAHRRADRRPDRDLPRRVRPRAARPGGQLHGRHPHRHPLDRRGPVHLRRVGHDVRLPAGRLRRLPGAGAADDPGGRALHRGDAQARAQRAARGVVRPRRAQVEDDRQGRAADGVLAASSPASCSASPGSWARRPRC